MIMQILNRSGWNDRTWRAFLIRWLGISLALHLVTAIFSIGYQNSDEHFQILEFIAFKFGMAPASDLAIEFHRAMRCWIQPLFYMIGIAPLRSLGVSDPFVWATVVRIMSSLLGWLGVVGLALCVKVWVKDRFWQKCAVILLALTWYLPAFHARHSSENFSGTLFTLSIVLFTLSQNIRRNLILLFAVGLIMGLAVDTRIQAAPVMTLGFAAWILLIERQRWIDVLAIFGGGLTAVVIGLLVDRWGYGYWTFSPYNYYVFSIVEGKLDLAGVSPWWDYFRRIWTESWPILAPVYFFGMIAFWIRYPRHIWTWCFAPLFAFNVLVSHKETRFLFPMAHAAPLLLVMALQSKPELWRRATRWLSVALFGLLSALAMLILMFVPASMPTRFYDFVYHSKINEIYFLDRDPYVQLGIPMFFYRPENLMLKKIEPARDLKEANRESILVFHTSRNLPPGDWSKTCKPIFSIYPDWIREWNPRNFMRNANDWSLFRCGV